MIQSFWMLLFALIGAHLFFDYAGQGDFLSRAKNPEAPIEGVPWWLALLSHATIQGASVALITGYVSLGIVEILAHIYIDFGKCKGIIDFKADQMMHITCRVFYALAAFIMGHQINVVIS